MLETPEERIKLLRAGFASKMIEKLYIEGNKFTIVHTPAVVELVELDLPQDEETCISQEIAAECA